MSLMYFLCFDIITPKQRIWIVLPFIQECLFEISSVLMVWKKIFFKLLTYFHYVADISLCKVYGRSFKKLECSFLKNALVPSIVEIGLRGSREHFQKSSAYFLHVPIDSLLKSWRYHSFNQNWIPFTQRCFASKLVEIGSVVLDKISKNSIRILLWPSFLSHFHYVAIVSLLKNVAKTLIGTKFKKSHKVKRYYAPRLVEIDLGSEDF